MGGERMKSKITKRMSITEILQKHPETFKVFAKAGMHCIGCAAASFETLEDGAVAHGLDADKLVRDLNRKAKG
jgi:hybrid cluster-associated redox disulfide protein